MKRTVRLGTTMAATAAMCSLALTACGGSSTEAPAPSAAAPTVAASSVEPAAESVTPTPTTKPTTKEEKDQAFITSVRAKVASGDYTPTKGSSKKAQAGIKEYMAKLSDERLGALGEYNCSIRTTKGKPLSREDFLQVIMQSSLTEEGIKPVIGMTWDEAHKIICPKAG